MSYISKKRFYFGGLYLLSLILSLSCTKDFLDRAPSDLLSTEETFANIENAEKFLSGAYYYTPNWIFNVEGGSGHYTLAAAGEDAIDMLNEFSNVAIDLVHSDYSSAHFPLQDEWDKYYQAIRITNVFLENFYLIPENVGDVGDSNRRNRLKGEAYALRAYFHFLLFQLWGEIPIIHEPIDPGSLTDLDLIRDNINDVIDSIKIDLERSENFLPPTMKGNEVGRINGIVAAKALLSRVMLFYASPLSNPGNDEDRWIAAANSSLAAIDYAEENGIVFSEAKKNGLEAYERIFLELRNEETIWGPNKSSISTTQSHYWNEMMGSLADNGWYGEAPSQNIVDAYETIDGEIPIIGYNEDDTQMVNPKANYDPQNPWVNRDPRFYQSILYHGANWKGRTIDVRPNGADYLHDRARVFYFYKKRIEEGHNLFTGQGSLDRRYIDIRLTELYLNYIEAENELNGSSQEIYYYLNKIRARAGMPDIPANLSKDEMREKIRHERRIELAFENKRFFDVRRWKIGEKIAGTKRSVQVSEDGDIFYPKWDELIFTERNYYLPIPQKELDRNHNFTQNPGW